MAIYDYSCGDCGDIQEVKHAMNIEPDVFCFICGNMCEKIFLKAPSIHIPKNMQAVPKKKTWFTSVKPSNPENSDK